MLVLINILSPNNSKSNIHPILLSEKRPCIFPITEHLAINIPMENGNKKLT